MSINWDDQLRAADAAIGLVDPDTYDVKVVEAKAVKAKTGADMIKITYMIQGGPFDGRRLFDNLVFKWESPANIGMSVRSLGIFGITRENLISGRMQLTEVAEKLMGRSAVVDVSLREWNGQPMVDVQLNAAASNRMSNLSGTPGPAPTPLQAQAQPPLPSLPPSPPSPQPSPPPPASRPGGGDEGSGGDPF